MRLHPKLCLWATGQSNLFLFHVDIIVVRACMCACIWYVCCVTSSLSFLSSQDEDEGIPPAPSRATFSAPQDLLNDAARGEEVRDHHKHR